MDTLTVIVEATSGGAVLKFRCACGELLESDFPGGFACRCGAQVALGDALCALGQAQAALVGAVAMVQSEG